jgi:L-ascorbate metabolism protein UlaG (beta-lactamase superfamily)
MVSTSLRFLGHAALWLETGDSHILVDPFITGNPLAPVKAEDLQPEYILVTHGHGDHLGDSVEIARRSGAAVITNAEIRDWLKQKSVRSFGMNIGGSHQFPFGTLKMTQAIHSSGLDDGTPGGSPAGFVLRTLDEKCLYMAGDTGLFGDMKLIGDEGLDVALIPIGDNYTMGPEDALRAVKLLHPQIVIPIHYNTFEVIKQDARAWAELVESQTGTKVHILEPGETLRL